MKIRKIEPIRAKIHPQKRGILKTQAQKPESQHNPDAAKAVNYGENRALKQITSDDRAGHMTLEAASGSVSIGSGHSGVAMPVIGAHAPKNMSGGKKQLIFMSARD